MAYNKAKEERNWRLWKEAEETKMRELGVGEDTIDQLRIHDWAIFNSDRRYYEKLQETGTYLEEVAESDLPSDVKSVDDFLDSIKNECLYRVLIEVDKLTLKAVLLKIQGFSYCEIAFQLGMTEKSVYRRQAQRKIKLFKRLKKVHIR